MAIFIAHRQYHRSHDANSSQNQKIAFQDVLHLGHSLHKTFPAKPLGWLPIIKIRCISKNWSKNWPCRWHVKWVSTHLDDLFLLVHIMLYCFHLCQNIMQISSSQFQCDFVGIDIRLNVSCLMYILRWFFNVNQLPGKCFNKLLKIRFFQL